MLVKQGRIKSLDVRLQNFEDYGPAIRMNDVVEQQGNIINIAFDSGKASSLILVLKNQTNS
jgi:hypothetical protein